MKILKELIFNILFSYPILFLARVFGLLHIKLLQWKVWELVKFTGENRFYLNDLEYGSHFYYDERAITVFLLRLLKRAKHNVYPVKFTDAQEGGRAGSRFFGNATGADFMVCFVDDYGNLVLPSIAVQAKLSREENGRNIIPNIDRNQLTDIVQFSRRVCAKPIHVVYNGVTTNLGWNQDRKLNSILWSPTFSLVQRGVGGNFDLSRNNNLFVESTQFLKILFGLEEGNVYPGQKKIQRILELIEKREGETEFRNLYEFMGMNIHEYMKIVSSQVSKDFNKYKFISNLENGNEEEFYFPDFTNFLVVPIGSNELRIRSNSIDFILS